MGFLTAIEQSGFCTWVRESGSMWAYPLILFLHTVGLGFVVGTCMVVDLRLLGYAPRIPLKPIERFFPYLWAGFWISAISGTILLAADATTKVISTIFYVKMAFIILGVCLIPTLRRSVLGDGSGRAGASASMKGKIVAAISLACWAGAITAGRLQAYLGPVSGAAGLTNHF
jgi:hypothetical protein